MGRLAAALDQPPPEFGSGFGSLDKSGETPGGDGESPGAEKHRPTKKRVTESPDVAGIVAVDVKDKPRASKVCRWLSRIYCAGMCAGNAAEARGGGEAPAERGGTPEGPRRFVVPRSGEFHCIVFAC